MNDPIWAVLRASGTLRQSSGLASGIQIAESLHNDAFGLFTRKTRLAS